MKRRGEFSRARRRAYAGGGATRNVAWCTVARTATVVSLLPFGPALLRYSRVVWMHFDRLVDRDPENEQYVPLGQPIGCALRGPNRVMKNHSSDMFAE